MMGLHFMKEVPFHTVYIHALVRDEKGQKMSKSKGNVVDPLDFIEKYGADSLRFTMAAMAAQGRDLRLSEQRVEGYRNFRTKLWNAARFTQMNECSFSDDFDPAKVSLPLNQWLVHGAMQARDDLVTALEAYRFNDAAAVIYKFAWNLYCDWYLEFAKPVFGGEDVSAREETRATAAWGFDQILIMLHPFMPFVTEELWGALAPRKEKLIHAQWPVLSYRSEESFAEMNWVIDLISQIRSLRTEMNVPAGARIALFVGAGHEALSAKLARHRSLIEKLARVEGIREGDFPKGSVQIILGEDSFALPIADHIDLGAEKARLEKEIAKVNGEIAKIDGKLANAKFVERAPKEVVEEQKQRRVDFSATLESLNAALVRLQSL